MEEVQIYAFFPLQKTNNHKDLSLKKTDCFSYKKDIFDTLNPKQKPN